MKEEVEEVAAPEKQRAVKRSQGLQRSPSGASNSLSTISQKEEVEEEGEEMEDGRLDIVEQLDYKQDKSLCAARLVCRNPGKVLRRKDSSGSILKEGQLTRADYTGGPNRLQSNLCLSRVIALIQARGRFCSWHPHIQVVNLTISQSVFRGEGIDFNIQALLYCWW